MRRDIFADACRYFITNTRVLTQIYVGAQRERVRWYCERWECAPEGALPTKHVTRAFSARRRFAHNESRSQGPIQSAHTRTSRSGDLLFLFRRFPGNLIPGTIATESIVYRAFYERARPARLRPRLVFTSTREPLNIPTFCFSHTLAGSNTLRPRARR